MTKRLGLCEGASEQSKGIQGTSLVLCSSVVGFGSGPH